MAFEDGQILNFRGVRVALPSTIEERQIGGRREMAARARLPPDSLAVGPIRSKRISVWGRTWKQTFMPHVRGQLLRASAKSQIIGYFARFSLHPPSPPRQRERDGSGDACNIHRVRVSRRIVAL